MTANVAVMVVVPLAMMIFPDGRTPGREVWRALNVFPATLGLLTFAPNPATGGSSTTATLTLGEGEAGPAGLDVTLTPLNPAVATCPAIVTIPPYSRFVTFTVQTYTVASNRTAGFTASARSGVTTTTGTLTVTP